MIEKTRWTKRENRRDGKTVMKHTAASYKRRVIGAFRKIEDWIFIGLTGRKNDIRMNPTTLALWNEKKYIIHQLCKGLERRVEGDYCA